MQITKITTRVLKTPLGKERFYSSQAAFSERTSLLVRLDTDAGLVGWGEGGQYGPPEPVATCVHAVLGAQVLSSDPRSPAVLWERLYSMIRDFGQKGPYLEAISAIDIACWDLFGQATGLPVYTLLGGAFRESVTAYATGGYYRGEDAFGVSEDVLQTLANEARSYIGDGFQILKIKLGLLSIEADVRRVETIREAIGPSATLLADANHAYTSMVRCASGANWSGSMCAGLRKRSCRKTWRAIENCASPCPFPSPAASANIPAMASETCSCKAALTLSNQICAVPEVFQNS